MNEQFMKYNVYRKNELVPLKRAYMELILRRAIADKVSPYQYNVYGGSWIWLRIDGFSFTDTQVKFMIRRGDLCYPIFWLPIKKKDLEFLEHMGQLFRDL